MPITTRKTYPFRSFYRGKERVAFYVISVFGEEAHITIYSDHIRAKGPDCAGFNKSELEKDRFRVYDFLKQYLPEELTDAIIKYAMKDLGVKRGFSLHSYAKWKENR